MTVNEPFSQLKCGCEVKVIDDVLHAYPCSAEHEIMLASVMRKWCEGAGIAFAEVD